MTVRSKLVEKPSFRTLVGTPKQIRKGLDHVIADQVIAVILEHARGQAGRALAETVVAIAPLIPNIQERRQKEMFNSIVEALVPREPPPPHLVTEAQMTANARTKGPRKWRLDYRATDRKNSRLQSEESERSAKQVEEAGTNLRHTPSRRGLFSGICFGRS